MHHPAGVLVASPELSNMNGVAWYDTRNQRIDAGGGNLFQENDVFSLIGESKKTSVNAPVLSFPQAAIY